MLFPNLEANLTINDKLKLGYVELNLTFKDNPEIEIIIEQCFDKAKPRFNSDKERISSKQLPLTDTGKKEILQIIKELKDLDTKFGNRSKIVEEFESLLDE